MVEVKVRKFILLMLVIFLLCFIAWPVQARWLEDSPRFGSQEKKVADWTIIGYFNGDNSLAKSILTIIDYKLERIGSSDNVNVLILYDGAPDTKYYGQDFSGTKLLYLEKDEEFKKINSRVLTEFKGEADMGSPETVEKLVRYALTCFPAKRYMFLTFTHGDGIINGIINGFSPDITSKSKLSVGDFHTALKRGLRGKKLTALVMFSCLMNMIEINYALKDITELFLGSPEIISFTAYPFEGLALNSPSGIAFDGVIEKLQEDPEITKEKLTRFTIDVSAELYKEPVVSFRGSYYQSLSLAGIDTKEINEFVSYFKEFSQTLKNRLGDPKTQIETLNMLSKAASVSRYYLGPYCDLHDFLSKIDTHSGDEEIKRLAVRLIWILKKKLILYERYQYMEKDESRGIGIYFPRPCVVERVYQFYQRTYKKSQFAKDTSWNEVIELFRRLAKNKASS